MSDKYICSGDKLTNIGDAIRTKTGSSDKLTLDGMASTINLIPEGINLQIALMTKWEDISISKHVYYFDDIPYSDNLNIIMCIYDFNATVKYSALAVNNYLLYYLNYNGISQSAYAPFVKSSSELYINNNDTSINIGNNNGKLCVINTHSEQYTATSFPQNGFICFAWNN